MKLLEPAPEETTYQEVLSSCRTIHGRMRRRQQDDIRDQLKLGAVVSAKLGKSEASYGRLARDLTEKKTNIFRWARASQGAEALAAAGVPPVERLALGVRGLAALSTLSAKDALKLARRARDKKWSANKLEKEVRLRRADIEGWDRANPIPCRPCAEPSDDEIADVERHVRDLAAKRQPEERKRYVELLLAELRGRLLPADVIETEVAS